MGANKFQGNFVENKTENENEEIKILLFIHGQYPCNFQ